MQISVGVFWHVIVEHDIDSLYVHASAKEVSSNKHSLAEALEGLILGQSDKKTKQTTL